MVLINKKEKKEAIIYGLELITQRLNDLEDSNEVNQENEEEIRICENLISTLYEFNL